MVATRSPDTGDLNIPVAHCRAERAKHNAWRLVVAECPYCRAAHHHGGGVGAKPTYGVRVAHCVTGKIAGYELRPASADGTR